MSQSMLEKVAEAIFYGFKEQVNTSENMMEWNELSKEGKQIGIEIAKKVFKTIEEYGFNNGDYSVIEALIKGVSNDTN